MDRSQSRRSCSSMSIDFDNSHRNSSVLPSHLEDDAYYRCCCGVHVHMGTFIISVLFCIQWILTIIPFLTVTKWEYLTVFLPIFTALPPIMLLIGNRKNFPALYWPHIFLHGTLFAIIIISALTVLVLGCMMMISGIPKELRRSKRFYKFMKQFSELSVTLIGLALFVLGYFCYYLLHVVYRGYRFLVEALYYD